jgi:hypothetical protein
MKSDFSEPVDLDKVRFGPMPDCAAGRQYRQYAIQLAEEVERLREGFITHSNRIITALDNCMHEYGEDERGQAARDWIEAVHNPEGKCG